MKRCVFAVGITILLILGFGFELGADEPVEAGDEDIFFMEIPMVVASSKREQLITETASSVMVVTAEDIKQSGAINLGDVLRSVAGVDIREAHASQHVIGIRGFADTAHVLVTIDGNNVFMYHANHIFLDWAPIDLEEVDRIEIIKGPGAIFYGGSAFSGVINIITKTPRQLEGTQVNVAGGHKSTIRSNVIHAGVQGNWEYSVSGGHREAEEWEKPKMAQTKEYFSVDFFSGRAVYNIDDESSISLTARHSEAKNVISRVCNPDTTLISLRYDRPDFWARFFYNNHQKTFWNDFHGVDDSNYELELFRTLKWGKNITSFGGYLKHTAWEVAALADRPAYSVVKGTREVHDVEDYALNIENEYRFNDQLIFSLGGRCEYYSHLDFLGLGRGSVIYKPVDDQSIRFTIANGYYIPSLFQHTNQGTAYPFALGDSSVEEEKIISYELAYYNQLTKKLKLNAAIFYNDYQDLIDNTQSGPMKNVADGYQYGGELGLDFIVTDWLTGFANYAYQNIHRQDFDNMHVDPEHKVNCGLRSKFGKWSTNFIFHYVDSYHEIYLTSNPVFGLVSPGPSKVKAYTTVEARIAYAPTDNLELAIAAYNLFNDSHYESNTDDYHTADEIGRRITGSISYKF